MNAAAPALSLSGITKHFGPVCALAEVSLDLMRGEIHALVGENGAGKSTLMNIAYGLLRPDGGRIAVGGAERSWRSAEEAIEAGLGMVHQHFMLCETMTVLENVILGAEPAGAAGFVGLAAARARVAELAAHYRFRLDPRTRIGNLTMGERQQVEILKMLYRGAELFILDEPTAVLTPQERDRLFETLRDFRAAGKAILLSTHKLEEVMAVSDRVSVMRAGRMVASAPTASTSREEITRAMIGRPLVEELPRLDRPPGAPVLELSGLTVIGHHRLPAVREVSLQVRGGEIVGIAGVAGNGQKELIEAVVGLRPAAAGRVAIAGADVTRAPIGARREAGLAFVPEDRQTVGLGLSATVAENAIAGRERTAAFSAGGRLRHRAIRDFAAGLIERFGIRVRGPEAPAGSMSGGNRQKLVMARELTRGRPLLVVENPTWGVDIGASEMIHRELIAARDAGAAILLVSTELTEILELSDRILVMFAGTVAGEMPARGADEYVIGQLMTGTGGEAAA